MNRPFFLLLLVFILGCKWMIAQPIENAKKKEKSIEDFIAAQTMFELAKKQAAIDSSLTMDYLRKIQPRLLDLSNKEHQALLKDKLSLLQEISDTAYENAALLTIEHMQQLNDTLFRYYIRQTLVSHYFMNFRFDAAIDQAAVLVELLQNSSFSKELTSIIYHKSVCHYASNEYLEALELIFKSIEYSQHSKDNQQLGKAYFHLGNIYYFLGSSLDAEEFYLIARGYFQREADKKGEALSNSNLGLLYIDNKEFTKGISLEMKALPILLEENEELSLSNIYHYLSEAYINLKEYDSARIYVSKALAYNKKLSYQTGIALDYMFQAKIALEDNQLAFAESLLEKSRAALAKQSDTEAEKDILLFEYEFYEKKQDLSKAFEALKSYIALKDSSNIDLDKMKVLALKQKAKLNQTQYELKQAHTKADLKQRDNQIKEKQIWITSLVAIVSILTLFFTLFIIYRNNKLTKELELQKDRIKKDLNVKQSLLSEIHHRVKNNLQIISSMLNIQSQYVDDEHLQTVIKESISRINSMSLIHESLYKRKETESPLFNDYVANLIPQLIETYHVDENQIKLKLELENIYLSLDDSVPCGLIINELVSNSLKHAFPNGKNGEISIKMYEKEQQIHLKVSDNGHGIEESIEPEKQGTFGFLLIYSFASQLEATVTLNKKSGLAFHFVWQKEQTSIDLQS